MRWLARVCVQFTKVEMFAFSTPQHSDRLLEEIVGIQEALYRQLELPFRYGHRRKDCFTE